MTTLLTILHVIVALFLTVVVLLQAGKGGGMGAAFGGAGQQIFGGRGAGSFLARVTTIMAIIFFVTSLTLSMMSSRHRSVVTQALQRKQTTQATQPAEAPAAPGAAQEPAAPAPAPTGTQKDSSAAPAPVPSAPAAGDKAPSGK